jgi:hypothetical protein
MSRVILNLAAETVEGNPENVGRSGVALTPDMPQERPGWDDSGVTWRQHRPRRQIRCKSGS